jgi:GNAT superfamily N-acetyltransferase
MTEDEYVEYVEVNLKEHKQVLLEFTLNYMHWIQKNVKKMYYVDMFEEVGTPLVDYVHDYVENKSTSPEFKYFLVRNTQVNNYIGMGGIRKHSGKICEIVHMHVRSEYHGEGRGVQLLKFLLDTAKSMGYKKVRLDTLGFMESANRIYEYFGFEEIPPYPQSEVPAKLHRIMKYYELNTSKIL